jgi:hypothetical protein
MAGDWIKKRETELATQSTEFAANIAAGPPAVFGLQNSDSTQMTSYASDFNTKLNAALNPDTRTPVSIALKDTSRAVLEAFMRSIGGRVRANPAVTAAQKISLGITVTSPPSPVPPPSTRPVLSVVGIVNLDVTLRLVDELTPTTRARPRGAIGANIWSWVAPTAGAEPPADRELWRFEAFASRSEETISFNAADAGKTIHIQAAWMNRKGEFGPTSAQITTVIAVAATGT